MLQTDFDLCLFCVVLEELIVVCVNSCGVGEGCWVFDSTWEGHSMVSVVLWTKDYSIAYKMGILWVFWIQASMTLPIDRVLMCELLIQSGLALGSWLYITCVIHRTCPKLRSRRWIQETQWQIEKRWLLKINHVHLHRTCPSSPDMSILSV